MLRRILALGTVAAVVLAAASCVRTARPAPHVSQALLKTWLHSFEEDQGNIEVYRPRGFSFPLARGRIGFAIMRDGSFIQYDIGPADGIVEIPGTWTLESEDVLLIRLRRIGSTGQRAYRMQIVSLSPDMLKIRRL